MPLLPNNLTKPSFALFTHSRKTYIPSNMANMFENIPIIPVPDMITGDAFRINRTLHGNAKVPLTGVVRLKGDHHDIVCRFGKIFEFQANQLIIQLEAIDHIDQSSLLLSVPYTDAVMTWGQRLQYVWAYLTLRVYEEDVACVFNRPCTHPIS